jgi:hypothetical protein
LECSSPLPCHTKYSVILSTVFVPNLLHSSLTESSSSTPFLSSSSCPTPTFLLSSSSCFPPSPPPVFLLLLLAGSRPRRDVWVHEQLPGDCEGHRQRGILVRHTHEIGLMLSVVCHMMLCQETAIIALSVSLLLAALKQLGLVSRTATYSPPLSYTHTSLLPSYSVTLVT